jgi:hypothetical protein
MAYDPEADEPIFELDLGAEGKEYLHRWNTSQFTFLGDLAVYNHVFIVTEEDDEQASGWYMFNTADAYEEVIDFIRENDLPQHHNLTQCSEMDISAWYTHYMGKSLIADSFPEEWTDD